MVESVKAASEVYAPLAGSVSARNGALADSPEAINRDPYGDGWLFRLRPTEIAAMESLLDANSYAALVAQA